MTIYFAKRSDGRIKIGFTGRPVDRRLRDLATAAGPLELIGTLAGDKAVEHALHVRFARQRADGEFFSLTVEEARAVIASFEARTATGQLVKRSGLWSMRLFVDGRYVTRATGVGDRREAQDALARTLAELRCGAAVPMATPTRRGTRRLLSPIEEIAKEREQHDKLYRKLEMEHEACRYRMRSQAELQTASAGAIAEVISYVIRQLLRDPVGRQHQIRVWEAAQLAAAREWAAINGGEVT